MRSSSAPRIFASRTALIAALLGLAVISACSPEASRTRSGGQGADVGNRDYPLPELHAVRDPAFKTPLVGQAIRK